MFIAQEVLIATHLELQTHLLLLSTLKGLLQYRGQVALESTPLREATEHAPVPTAQLAFGYD